MTLATVVTAATGRGHHRIATLTEADVNSSVSSVAFSPNGKLLATANQDGATSLWSIATAASHP
jgi:WD40 repeat protein